MADPQAQLVNIPGVGLASFPHDMPKEKIVSVIKKHLAKNHSAAPSGEGTGEGTYAMFGKLPGKSEAVGQISIPYSSVPDALRRGFTFYGTSGDTYNKDKAAEGQKPSLLGRIDEGIQKALQPVDKPAYVPFAGPLADTNQFRAAGRVLYGIPSYAKDLASAYTRVAKGEAGPEELVDLIDPGKMGEDIYRQFQDDWKKDPRLAIDNLIGTATGLAAVGGVTHKVAELAKPKIEQLSRTVAPMAERLLKEEEGSAKLPGKDKAPRQKPPQETPAAPDKKRVEPATWLRASAQKFAEQHGRDINFAQNITPDFRAKSIADAYAAMKHDPADPKVAAAYSAMKSDIDQQWDHAIDNGMKFEPWNKEGQPYANSAEMTADVNDNKHLYFFQGGDMPADHPLAEKSGEFTYNDKLRAVHDLFGHAMEGYQFGPRGEENAWNAHAQMFSPEALPALTSETKGQNSWVNSGPHMRDAQGNLLKAGDPGFLEPKARPFAEQKAGLLPEDYHYRMDTPVSFVSPNVHDLNVDQAQTRIGHPEHRQTVALSIFLANALKTRPVVRSAIGFWEGGAENSLVHHFAPGSDPDAVIYHALNIAKLTHQNAMTSFFPDPAGPDRMYSFEVPEDKDVKEIARVLLENGIQGGTIEPTQHGHTVLVSSEGGKLESVIDAITSKLEVEDVGRVAGKAVTHGDYTSRDAAGRKFDELLAEIESRKPGWREIRRSAESRPDYADVFKAVRNPGKTEDLFLEPRRARSPGPDNPGYGVSKKTTHGLWPAFRVMAPKDSVIPKKPLIISGTKNANAAQYLPNLDTVLDKHPQAAASIENWTRMTAEALGSRDVPIPPYAFIRDLKGDGMAKKLESLSPEQIEHANLGLQNAAEFRRAYTNGELGIDTTGKLLLWSILSRGVSPYVQEGLFIDAFNGAVPWIEKAARGEFTEKDLPAYERWSSSVAAKGSDLPGAGATHNLSAFGKHFLLRMSKVGENGKTHLQHLHDMLSDPNMTGKQIRREFQKFKEGVGIDNKVISFTLLVTGHDDVMVLDRVQFRQLWDDGRFNDLNLYDGSIPEGKSLPEKKSRIGHLGEGIRGLLHYEAIERALGERVKDAYAKVGRPDDASIGRYHWESWVGSSGQEASHGTLEAILEDAKGNDQAIAGVAARQGNFSAYSYGTEYSRDASGTPSFTYNTPSGNRYGFSVPKYRIFLDEVRKPHNGVVPSGFTVDLPKEDPNANIPWYARPGVDQKKLDHLAGKWSDLDPKQGRSAAEKSVLQPEAGADSSGATDFDFGFGFGFGGDGDVDVEPPPPIAPPAAIVGAPKAPATAVAAGSSPDNLANVSRVGPESSIKEIREEALRRRPTLSSLPPNSLGKKILK
jgi:hypothetical protein